VAVIVVIVTTVATPLLSVVAAETCAIPAFSDATELQYSLYTPIADVTSTRFVQVCVERQLVRKKEADPAKSGRQ